VEDIVTKKDVVYTLTITFNSFTPTTTPSTDLPTLTTTAILVFTSEDAISGGNVTNKGSSDVTEKGLVWSTSANPTIALTTKTKNGSGTGAFTASIKDLSSGTKYYVRAYAINAKGTAYGNQVEFTTSGSSSGNIESLLTGKNWELTGLTIDGVDQFGTLPLCQKDNIIVFNLNGTANVNEGSNICTPSSAGPFTWSLNSAKTEITLTNGSGPSISSFIVTSSRLTLRINDSGGDIVFIYTKK